MLTGGREPLIIENSMEDPRVNHLEPVHDLKIGGYLSVPVILPDNTMIATLCAADPEPYSFTSTEIEDMKRLANIYSFILTQNYTKTCSKEEEVRVHAMGVISELAGDLADQVRNPMQTVKGFVQLLLQEPKFADKRQIILNELADMEKNIDRFLLSTKPAYPIRKKMSLASLLLEVISDLKDIADESGVIVQLTTQALDELTADKGQIKQAIYNFVKNGIDATKSTKGVVQVSASKDSEQYLSVTITDNGPGIPISDMNKIGTPLFTSKENGHGLGISVAAQIIEVHGGFITIETSKSGTSVLIKLPLNDI